MVIETPSPDFIYNMRKGELIKNIAIFHQVRSDYNHFYYKVICLLALHDAMNRLKLDL